jgi:hypothetical protein
MEKSGIRKPVNFTILGFGFVTVYKKGSKNQYQLVEAEKAWKKKGSSKALPEKPRQSIWKVAWLS